MADCSNLFLSFEKAVSLSKTDRKFLRTSRKAIIDAIRAYFEENDRCPRIDFFGQGSFSMGTIVKPLAGEYDIDIGVYLRGYSNWRDKWPSTETVSRWITEALKNQTSNPPVNKRNCVRIIYKPTTPNKEVAYHVDLPIYCEYENFLGDRYTRIGITGEKQWSQKSDPIGFTKWFISKCLVNQSDKNQLVRLVKYLKAWKDFKKGETKFPSGMALTILLANNYVPDQRDDLAFQRTIVAAYNNMFSRILALLFSEYEVLSPVQPYNNTVSRLTEGELKTFRTRFGLLVEDAKRAIQAPDAEKARNFWKQHFDERM